MKNLQSPIKPLRHRITALIQYETEKVATGTLDGALGVQDFVAARLSGFNDNHDTVNHRSEHCGLSRSPERSAVDQNVVKTHAQSIDRIQTGIDRFALLRYPHQKRPLWQRLRLICVLLLFLCRQHPEVFNIRRMTVPGHLQIIFNAQTLQSLRLNNERASTRVAGHLNREQLGYMTDAFTVRS